MATLQELEQPIDEAIARALIEATPEWWKAVRLEVTRPDEGPGTEDLAHEITSPEGHRDPMMPTDEVFAATGQLADLFARFGKPWRRVTYLVREEPSGEWRYTANFDY